MEILDHEENRHAFRKGDQEGENAAEELDLFELIIRRGSRHTLFFDRGDEPTEVWHDAYQGVRKLDVLGMGSDIAEGIDEGHVGEPDITGLHTSADQDSHAPALGAGGQFGKQTRLAHTRITGDQRYRAIAPLGPLEKLYEPTELLGPADEEGARSGHDAASIAPDHGANVGGPPGVGPPTLMGPVIFN